MASFGAAGRLPVEKQPAAAVPDLVPVEQWDDRSKKFVTRMVPTPSAIKSNLFEDAARRVKADKLADVLELSPDAVRLMNDAEWSDAAYVAKVRWPISQLTRDLVVAIRTERERVQWTARIIP